MDRSDSEEDDDDDTSLEVEDWVALLAAATAGAARRARAEDHSEADVARWMIPIRKVADALSRLAPPDGRLLEPLVAMDRWGRRKRAREDED